jgi:DNA modification methylase
MEFPWLMSGNCLEEMDKIPGSSVDLILTDPPYGTTKCSWDSVIPFEPMWEQIWRVLKPNGACVLFGSEPFSSYLRMSQIKYFKYDWIWEKDRGTGIGNSAKMPLKKHEIISVFYREQPTYDPKGDLLERPTRHVLPVIGSETSGLTSTQSLDERGNRIYKIYEYLTKHSLLYAARTCAKNEVNLHPTQKPVLLLEYLIETYTKKEDIVLDFTMGSGSTGIACKNINRNFIGIELNKDYFEIAKSRILLGDITSKKAIKEEFYYDLWA